MMDVVAIVGNRAFQRDDAIKRYIDKHVPVQAAIVSGGAVGADRTAEHYATMFANVRRPKRVTVQGCGDEPRSGEFLVVRPNYKVYPPKLAPIHRNALIADMCSRMVAFLCKMKGGTVSAVRFAHSMGKPVEVYLWDERYRKWFVFSGEDFGYVGQQPRTPQLCRHDGVFGAVLPSGASRSRGRPS